MPSCTTFRLQHLEYIQEPSSIAHQEANESSCIGICVVNFVVHRHSIVIVYLFFVCRRACLGTRHFLNGSASLSRALLWPPRMLQGIPCVVVIIAGFLYSTKNCAACQVPILTIKFSKGRANADRTNIHQRPQFSNMKALNVNHYHLETRWNWKGN